MDNVEFDEQNENNAFSRQILGEPQEPGFSRLLVKIKIARSDSHAYRILLTLICLCVVVSVWILYRTYFVQTGGNNVSPEKIEHVMQESLKKNVQE
jgi:hypothetical protein